MLGGCRCPSKNMLPVPHHLLFHSLFFPSEHVLRPGRLLRRERAALGFPELHLLPETVISLLPQSDSPLTPTSLLFQMTTAVWCCSPLQKQGATTSTPATWM